MGPNRRGNRLPIDSRAAGAADAPGCAAGSRLVIESISAAGAAVFIADRIRVPGVVRKAVRRTLSLAAVTLSLCLAPGCSALRSPGVPLPDVWPGEQWPVSTPEAQGIDSRVLVQALDLVREKDINIHSLLIVRNGRLVLDVYFYPYDGKTPHDVASVTKSIMTTLVGLAVQKGFIADVSRPALGFFPELEVPERELKTRITVENLLCMASGFECGYRPHEAELIDMLKSPDWIRSIWDLPMRTTPGSEFAYCSGDMHLLSAIVARATGMTTLEFARTNLFEPIGIREVRWPVDPQGVNHGWGDLQLHPRDLARIGFLFLHRGRWGERQVLDADWVDRATSRQVGVRGGPEGYGYGWWLPGPEFPGLFEARGRGEQSITVWPRQNLVAVFTGGGYDRDELARLLATAFRSDHALPENPGAYGELQERLRRTGKPPEPMTVPPLPKTAGWVSGVTWLLEPNRPGVADIALVFPPAPGRSDASLAGHSVPTVAPAGGESSPGPVSERPDRKERTSVWRPADQGFVPAAVEALFSFSWQGKTYRLPMGLDGVYRISSDSPTGLPTGVKGTWVSESEFVVDYNETAGINHFQIRLNFGAGKAGGEEVVEVGIKDTTGYFDETVMGRAER